ncbi:hypothetical protein OROGR_006594 [Orobanche gracilis]
MMAIPMENNNSNSSRELVQRLFDKNLELESKRRKAGNSRIPLDPNAWQQMRENFEAILLEDHAFSEQHDTEYALWQLHYKRIEELRALFNTALTSASSGAPQNGQDPVRSGPDRLAKIRSQIRTFLSEATGFYHDLMLKIRAKYNLPLEYFSEDSDNQILTSKDGDISSDLKKGLISCHRCLIYLGDLARYKRLYGEGDSKARDFAAASSYYMQASSLCPSNGNPHHQLAILAGYSNDELVTIYRYFRSLAVENPFVTARDNLIIAFEKNRQNYIQLVGDGKATTVKTVPSRMSGKGRSKGGARQFVKEVRAESNAIKERGQNDPAVFKAFVTRFIRLNGILFTRTSLETFAGMFSTVKTDLLNLLSYGPDEDLTFGSDARECRLAVVRMIAILIYTVHNVKKENENQSYAEILQRSVLLQNALSSTFEFVGCMVERCNQLNDPSSSNLLPGIMVFLEWLACCPDVAVGSELGEKQINMRVFFWKKFISLLNKLLSDIYTFVNEHEEETCFSNMSKYDERETANRLALAEDFELRGFLPLLPAHLILDFSRKHLFGGDGGNTEKTARVQRIIAAGKAIASVIRIEEEGVYFDTKLNKFEIGNEPQFSDDYLLTSPSESNLNGISIGISAGDERNLGHVTKVEVGVEVEDEDEDEVIVFRPLTNEKHMDNLAFSLTPSGFIAPVIGNGKIDVGKGNGSFSVLHDSPSFQNELNARPLSPAAHVTSQYLPPVQPSTSRWPAGPDLTMNGLAHLNLVESGSHLKTEMQEQFEVSEPAALSVPFPQFINKGVGPNYSRPIPKAAVPLKFDSIISSIAAADGLPVKPHSILHVKPHSILPPGLKKNPVSRPVRHSGPPLGFCSVPSKAMDDSLKIALKIENPAVSQIDDCSWLDGYPISLLNQGVGFSNSYNHVGLTLDSVNNSNGTTGTASFPFPGKQVSSLQVQSESEKLRQDCSFSEYMKAYEEQPQQFQKGNHQLLAPPQQYQEQSLWEGRFIV